nr:hypothetical protein [uncultured Chryseobacterium sp.]
MAYIKKTTKRELAVAEISDDYPIVRRFFVAIYYIIAKENLHGFKTFCDLQGWESRNLEKVIKEPHRSINLNYLNVLVVKFGISAIWLITGDEPMLVNAPVKP